MRLIHSVVCLSLLAACGPTTEVLNSWADPPAGLDGISLVPALTGNEGAQ